MDASSKHSSSHPPPPKTAHNVSTSQETLTSSAKSKQSSLKPHSRTSKEPQRSSSDVQKQRSGAAGTSPTEGQVDAEAEEVEEGPKEDPAYRLPRVQKIIKSENEQVQISREAAFVMALAAEELTRKLTRAAAETATKASREEVTVHDLGQPPFSIDCGVSAAHTCLISNPYIGVPQTIALVVSSTRPLAFLADLIPQTIPLCAARERRQAKEATPLSPSGDSSGLVYAKVQEQLRNNVKSMNFGHPKLGSIGGISAPISSLQGSSLPHGSGSGRTYSPREAKAVANSKKGRALAPMPVGGMPPNMPMALLPPGMTLPPGFDIRTLPMGPPPPGMPLPPGVDPEAYKKGIRWAPVQAGNTGQGMTGTEGHVMAMIPINRPPGTSNNGSTGPGMWSDMPFVPPHPNVHFPQGYQAGPITPTHSNSLRRSSSSSSSQPSPNPPSTSTASGATKLSSGTTKIEESEKNQVAETSDANKSTPVNTGTASGSAFNSTPLQGRTIYSAGINISLSNGSNDKDARTEVTSKSSKNGESVPKDNPKPEAPKKGRKSGGSKGIAK